LGILWLARHNLEINWKTGKVKITRCPEECGNQWRPKQGKSGWQKQKEKEAKEKARRKQEENKKRKKQKKEKTIDMKKVVKEWEIWDEKEKMVRLKEKAKKLVPEKFHK